MDDSVAIDDEGLVGVVAVLHGGCLQLLAQHLRRDFDGLAVNARTARRSRVINNGICKKMVRLDTAFAVLRHMTGPRAVVLFGGLMAMLRPAEEPAVDEIAAEQAEQNAKEQAGQGVRR